MTINEHTKFSTDLDPVAFFDTLQEAKLHERKITARRFVQNMADQEFTLSVSDEFTNAFVDNLIEGLCRLMEWEL
jgi:hypothetical protein